MGLIPAHAGKTAIAPRPSRQPGAHPRSRGENVIHREIQLRTKGSSPLTRGKPLTGAGNIFVIRLIPAHAGKTVEATYESVTERAHPRSRGENDKIKRISHGFEGSSPLTRGKLLED